ncbi:CACTA en-spm transposon protein [Cucumis melo var. makuwa]|uniref:CACTA en-spm transposon protein n=1 Tax=Cucumis melo var. makuwa TaxID=1194695 RepID=A0A5A7U8G4_CUCMM|nr:CACTA en-spm transposon protein [Cucumis melo var. makuwa]TYK07629.1 CACTA en-spm transposon protein [Cucumis melo var. makuwa]
MHEQSRTNKTARQKQPYNHSSGLKAFLQRQYELADKRGEPIDCTMSSFPSDFNETDAMFLEFVEDLYNPVGGTAQLFMTPIPRRHAQSRLLEFERYVHTNGRISMSIAFNMEKPILPHVVRFSQALGMCVRKTFPVCYLRFVEHQMLSTFKEFRGDCHRTFVSQAAEDAHNQIMELQSQPTLEGSEPLSRDEICEIVLGRRSSYSKGLCWGPKLKNLVRPPPCRHLHLSVAPISRPFFKPQTCGCVSHITHGDASPVVASVISRSRCIESATVQQRHRRHLLCWSSPSTDRQQAQPESTRQQPPEPRVRVAPPTSRKSRAELHKLSRVWSLPEPNRTRVLSRADQPAPSSSRAANRFLPSSRAS